MARILTITGKLASIHKKMEVTDETTGEVLYTVSAKAVSANHWTYVYRGQTDEQIAAIHRKGPSIHHIYLVDMADGTSFQMSTQLFHLKDIKDIPELGLQLRGNVMDFDFTIVDVATEKVLAKGHRRLASIHRIYDLEVIDESKMDELVCIFIMLRRMIDVRKAEYASTITTT